mgnify:CR=1 FL=1
MFKNNKGFMLVEVIITSTVILTGMILFYSSFNSLFSKYKEREVYHDIDAFYATKQMINTLLENNLNKFLNTHDNLETIDLIENGTCKESENNYINKNNFCTTLKELYQVKNMMFTYYDENVLENKRKSLNNETFKDYIDYIINYYNIKEANIGTNTNSYTYLVITEIENNGKNYYASIPIE